MNTVEKLEEMGQPIGNQCYVWNFEHSTKWTCTYKSSKNGTKLEIEKTATQLEEAVNKVYEAYCRITAKVPELSNALAYTPFTDITPSPLDDDIPF